MKCNDSVDEALARGEGWREIGSDQRLVHLQLNGWEGLHLSSSMKCNDSVDEALARGEGWGEVGSDQGLMHL